MRRGFLLSVITIGAAAAFVTGAFFSSFADEGTAEGDVVAGTLTLDVSGESGPEGPIVFPVAVDLDCPDPEAVMPGDICTGTATLTNTGTLAGVMDHGDAVLDVDGGEGCNAGLESGDWQLLLVSIADEDPGESNTKFPPGDVHLLTVEIELVDVQGSAFGCEGTVLTIEVPIFVEQAINPHSDDDTGAP